MSVRQATLAFPGTLLALALAAASATAQPILPRLSPAASVSQTLGVTEIDVAYGRPAVRDRVIWGALVPWNEVWRTGANEATTIAFSTDVKIDGRELAAGKYGLFTIPDEIEWTVIFNRVAEQWGAGRYDPAEDALRIPVKPRPAPFRERFEISFPEVGSDTLVVSLRWAEVEIPFTVQVDVEATTVAAAREFVAGAGPEDGQAVWNWTNYLYQRGWNLDEARGWATTLAAQAPMYWTHALEARLLAKTGQIDAARAAADKALARAGDDGEQPGVAADAETLRQERESWPAEAAGGD